MNTLEKYLTEEYPGDQREIRDIDQNFRSIANAYKGSYVKRTAWPYVITGAEGVSHAQELSLSTTSMILNSLLRMGNRYSNEEGARQECGLSGLVFPVEKGEEIFDEALMQQLVQAAQLIFDKTENLKNKKVRISSVASGAGKYSQISDSKTYGPNDVFTLAWLADICTADWEKVPEKFRSSLDGLRKRLREVLQGKLAAYRAAENASLGARVLFDPQLDGLDRPSPAPHAFPLLRLIQAARRLRMEIEDVSYFYKIFEGSLHEQLSFSSIPDSRFDPAELAFCLEGMLLCRRKTVDQTILDRVLAVLTQVQNQSPYWRPVKPFLTTKQGLVLFPVSVEIANSLLRACAIYDGEELHDTYSSKCLGLFRRYAQWLRARAVRIDLDGVEAVGWHSEHVNEADTIHLWETSQVLEFLISYRNALHLHIARTTLVLSRFTQKKYQRGAWSSLEQTFEAVSTLGSELKVYDCVGKEFVQPMLSDMGRKNYSMLLYGPPGTGKTTIAESIAEALGWRLVTITVSDFLASGEAQLEARAKDIFTVLMAQPACVIFFDEIDHFLLDRDSSRYSQQDSAFQFMTPGMLTKLNDLRRSKQALFVVATNYEDRIDAAIKRAGRIDKKFLVLPPDRKKRGQIIEKLVSKMTPPKRLRADELDKLADASTFLGYTDIAAVVDAADAGAGWVARLTTALANRARTISLEAYSSRFVSDSQRAPDVRETPMREFLGLVALKTQGSNAKFSAAEKAVLQAAATILGLSNAALPEQWKQALTSNVPEIDSAYVGGVADIIGKAFSN
ncbi:AAA family ATPase [Paraburkholderia sp. CNPSo 3281]|uniref:AAA family ATPase n=1 Tax=Paraburkholderia sp. CNPSo 3281 TaxID=2940933 RepID=UPI0020B6AA55|nr:AAA family ATPase [Paraburkholderia sp. CNPSo 3281]MCP3721383.1 AAA family ATPase [Paraburkholderia sp. CNPSo 3281]